jgi:hypothetical protein
MNGPSGTPIELVERLRKWIIVGGYALGGWVLFQNVLMVLAWGPSIFSRHFRFAASVPIQRLAVLLWLASPVLLLVGCWGFQRHRPWARPVLLTYAGAAVAGMFGMQVVHLADILSGAGGEMSFRQVLSAALGQLDLAVWASVFPAFVYLCLGRPEVRDTFPEFHHGFTPVGRWDDGAV